MSHQRLSGNCQCRTDTDDVFKLTEPSKVSEKVLLVSEAAVFGVRTNSCCTHLLATLFEAILTLASVFPLVSD